MEEIRQRLVAGDSVSHIARQLGKKYKVPRSRIYKLALDEHIQQET